MKGSPQSQYDEEELRSLISVGSTLKEIAKSKGYDYRLLWAWCKRRGLNSAARMTEKIDGDSVEKMYADGLTTIQIADRSGCSVAGVAYALKARGVKMRKSGQKEMQMPIPIDEMKRRYEDGESATHIAETIGVQHHMVEKWLKKNGVVLRKTKAGVVSGTKEDFFEKIDAEEKAYWLGFLSADGSLTLGNGVRLELKDSDGDHVRLFAATIGFKGKVAEDADRGLTRVELKSVKMCKDLEAAGLEKSTKSYTIVPATISVDLERHYWRGVVDGDGSISSDGEKSEWLSLVGTKAMCEEFSRFCLSIEGVKDAKVSEAQENLWRTSVYGVSARRVAEKLYAGSSVSLPRKAKLARRWFESESSVRRIYAYDAETFLRKHHYMGSLPIGCLSYGLFDGGALVGVAAVGSPSSPSVGQSIFGSKEKGRVCELRRFAIADGQGKNVSSMFLAEIIRCTRASRPNLDVMVSFADDRAGHIGTIYQAVGAKYLGSKDKSVLVSEDGREIVLGRGTPTEEGKWELKVVKGNHKYVILLKKGKEEKDGLEAEMKSNGVEFKEYPKRNVVECD